MIEPLASDYVHRAATAAGTSDTAPFVFQDAGGRRWSRIKRIAFAAAAALVALAGVVLLAVTHVAPGRAPLFSTDGAPVPDWPLRASASPPAPAPAATAAAAAGSATTRPGSHPGAAQPGPSSAGGASARPSAGPTPQPSPAHTASPRPKRPRPSASPG